jgi:hypothetical protein
MKYLNAGDYVEAAIHDVQAGCDFYYGEGLGSFSGYLLG